MNTRPTALEANISDYHVDVDVDPRYAPLQEVMSRYYGLTQGLTVFLKELSHPYKNWDFIVNEARGYSLDYFHLLKDHPLGPEAVDLFVDVFFQAIAQPVDDSLRADAIEFLLLYLQKIVNDADSQLERFSKGIDACFQRLSELPDGAAMLLVKSYYQLPKLADLWRRRASGLQAGYPGTIVPLLVVYYQRTIAYWLAESDPAEWFQQEGGRKAAETDLSEQFAPISHAYLHTQSERLAATLASDELSESEKLDALLMLDGFSDIVDAYRAMPQMLVAAGAAHHRGNHWKVIFLFHVMNLPGLSAIHEEALRDINQTLGWLIRNQSHRHIRQLVDKTFGILRTRIHEFPTTALNSVLNMGQGVYQIDESDLINYFIDAMIDLGFQAPMISGVGNDWQIKVNPAHIQNIRTWLALIQRNPKYSPRLLSYLTIHLALCGVFIKDTDLFPRDITTFLNSGIGPVYNLAKQLTRLFPVFFNDIGAEGLLRDISTELDELTQRRDTLIHFLRKQSHVESSNLIIPFMEAVLYFWEQRDRRLLESYVPPNIYNQVVNQGPFVDGVHQVVSGLKEGGFAWPGDFLSMAETEIDARLAKLTDVPAADARRVFLLGAFYKHLYQKYNLDFVALEHQLAQLKTEAFPELDRLRQALDAGSVKEKLSKLLDFLDVLKTLLISGDTFPVREDIYKKRHFTSDIPSMYGSYHEMKFDALGLTFRIESLANVLFEQLVNDIDLSLITKATFFQIHDRLLLFNKALELDGIGSGEMRRQLEMLAHGLEVRGFTFTQYLDIFKGFAQAVRNIINDYFNNIHEQNLARILDQIPGGMLLPRYTPPEGSMGEDRFKHRVSEMFFRDRIALSLGLQQLDTFLSRILKTLFRQSEELPGDKLRYLLNYDPQRAMASIINPPKRVHSIVHLGNKGLNLVSLRQSGMPVPPGFIVTTEAFRSKIILDTYPPAEANFKDQLTSQIERLEKATGKRFGDPQRPLLFSVRSGSAISQPGMMDTFLDVGMNQEIAEGLAQRTGNAWFAWDNYRRFLQCYGMAYDLTRDDFDAIIGDYKTRLGIPYKRRFSGNQMRAIAHSYREMVQDASIAVIDDPFEQLYMTIKAVLASWHSAKARTYRKIMGISDDWGTAVTVQEMVYGNISDQSGTGVFFTHSPRWGGDILKLWGDFTIGNQGEDVVSGLVNTLPISMLQQETEMRDTDITLETHFPHIYEGLQSWANELIYSKGWSPQEMEFTFESPDVEDLYLLQARDMAIRERKKEMAFDLDGVDAKRHVGHGIGVSGGAMAGRLVFTLEEIDQWRSKEPDTALVLGRNDTVPDDIREIHAADGLLTARGGVTSHASVVAHRLGKTCIVGCANLICDEKARECRFGQIPLKSGDYISIDGQEGSVYQGQLPLQETARLEGE